MLRIFFVQIYHKNNHNNIELIYIALIEISKQIASKWWAKELHSKWTLGPANLSPLAAIQAQPNEHPTALLEQYIGLFL